MIDDCASHWLDAVIGTDLYALRIGRNYFSHDKMVFSVGYAILTFMFRIISLGLICTVSSAASAVAISALHDASHIADLSTEVASDAVTVSKSGFVLPAHVASLPASQAEADLPAEVVAVASLDAPVSEQLDESLYTPMKVIHAEMSAPSVVAPAEVTPAVVNVSFGTRTMGADLVSPVRAEGYYVIGVYR